MDEAINDIDVLTIIICVAGVIFSIFLIFKFLELVQDVSTLKKATIQGSRKRYLEEAKEHYRLGELDAARNFLNRSFSAALIETNEFYRGKMRYFVNNSRAQAIKAIYDQYQPLYDKLQIPIPISLDDCLKSEEYL